MAEECEGIPSCCDDNWFGYQVCCPLPEVDAGPDQEIEDGTALNLAGTASDNATVLWTQISGPEATIATPTDVNTSVTYEGEGEYVFRLTATNHCGQVQDEVTVTVDPSPSECCVYPWPGLSDERLYSADDLPTHIIAGTELLFFTVPKTGDYEFFVDDMGYQITVTANEDGLWNAEVVGPEGTFNYSSPCLLAGWDALDGGSGFSTNAFELQYIGTYGVYDPIPLDRQSACEWTGSGVGTEDQPYTVRLYYDSNDYKWHVGVEIDATNFDWIKDDPQSSPVGSYEGNFTVSE